MGTGKTTVGKILSHKLNRKFVETDDVIEQREGKKITEIFSQYGEPYFRKLEKELLEELSAQSDLIISCGGGLICSPPNAQVLKSTGIVFNLLAAPATIYSRTKHYIHRPLLNVDDSSKKIEELLNERKPYYEQAHHSIDTDALSPEEIADTIMRILPNG